MRKSYVYIHTKGTTGEVFYVGIGTRRRAWSQEARNKHWHNVVKNHGYEVKITHLDLCREEACVIEKYLIAFYGRADMGVGTLVNWTDGGEGFVGYIMTEEQRNRISESKKGKPSGKKGYVMPQEVKDKVSLAKMGSPGFWTGKKRSREDRDKMGAPKIGKKQSAEAIAKRALAMTGKKFPGKILSTEHKEKLRISSLGNKSRTGIRDTEELKQKKRNAQLKRWAAIKTQAS